jgi:hypothetical protein
MKAKRRANSWFLGEGTEGAKKEGDAPPVPAALRLSLNVHSLTTHRYKKPVRPGLHQMLFRPRDSFDQRLLDSPSLQ